MRKPVTDPTQPRCGNCRFWGRVEKQPANVNQGMGEVGVCGGLPPQVLLMGMKQSQFQPGRAEMVTEMVQPNLPETFPPCALYHPLDIPDLRQAGPMSRLDA